MEGQRQPEARELIARAKEGDREALEDMVRRNVPLVRMAIRRFSAWSRDQEELYQQGCMGLEGHSAL